MEALFFPARLANGWRALRTSSQWRSKDACNHATAKQPGLWSSAAALLPLSRTHSHWEAEKKKNMRAWGARGEKVMDAALSRPHPIPTQLHQQEERKKKWVMCIPLNSALSDGQRHRKALNMTLSITTAMQAELAASKETAKSIFRVSQMCLTWHQNATYPKVTSFMKGHITPELNHRLMWSEGLDKCPLDLLNKQVIMFVGLCPSRRKPLVASSGKAVANSWPYMHGECSTESTGCGFLTEKNNF